MLRTYCDILIAGQCFLPTIHVITPCRSKAEVEEEISDLYTGTEVIIDYV